MSQAAVTDFIVTVYKSGVIGFLPGTTRKYEPVLEALEVLVERITADYAKQLAMLEERVKALEQELAERV